MKTIVNVNPGTREFTLCRLGSLTGEYPFLLLLFLRRVAWHLDAKQCFPDQIVANADGVEFVYQGSERDLHCLFYKDKTIAVHYSDNIEHIDYGGGSAKEVAKSLVRYVEQL